MKYLIKKCIKNKNFYEHKFIQYKYVDYCNDYCEISIEIPCNNINNDYYYLFIINYNMSLRE